MALDVIGKMHRVLGTQTGDGRQGQWTKQEFVIETEERFPRQICFSVWNDKVAQIQGINPGDLIKVSFEVSSREFNGKWYHDLRAWKVERSFGGNSNMQQNNNQNFNNQNFNQQNQNFNNQNQNFNQNQQVNNAPVSNGGAFDEENAGMVDDMPF